MTPSTSASATPPSPPTGPSPALQRLLHGPVLTTLVRLSLPNILGMVMTVLVGIAETWYVGRLGTTPLAAMALVFPFAMLTGMLSAGAMGGGVSSAISRALGARDAARANTLVVHALMIGAGLGLAYSVLLLVFGPGLYRLLGGREAVLAQAVGYAGVLFSGAVLLWVSNTLASVLRGTGNVRVPAQVLVATAILQIALGGTLGLGLGPVPSFGLPGLAVGHILATASGVAFFLWFLASGRSSLAVRWRGVTLRRELFADILRVGALSMVSPLQSVLAVLVFTRLVADLGVLPLAGYAIGQRLEFLLIPIAFGVGMAAVPMVGVAIGAGDVARARRVAWTAGGLSAFNLALVGLPVAVAPDLWAGLFTTDEAVLQHARQYLRTAGPAFPFFGLGLTLYFASQGAGKVLGPVVAGTVRLVLVAGAGSWLAAGGFGAPGYFALVAVAMVVYGLVTVGLIRMTPWVPRA